MAGEEKTAQKKTVQGKTTQASAPVEPKKYAVVRTGGKQYRVSPGDIFNIETLDAEVGGDVVLKDVLAVGMTGGECRVRSAQEQDLGVAVTVKVLAAVRAKKVVIFKKRRRGGYTKKQGHRQDQLRVRVESVA
jgi:large subunit ribosomal protein L21